MSVGPLSWKVSTKCSRVAADVAEVDEEDLLLAAPFARQRFDVLAHGLEIGLAEGDAVDRAGDDFEDAAVVFGAGQDAADAAQRRDGRIVGVQGHFDAGGLGDGDDLLQEVLEIGPDLLLGDLAPLGQALGLGGGVVEFGGEGAAALGHVGPGAIPAQAGHPVVAQDGDFGAAQGVDGGLVVFDLLVAAGQAELDLLGGHGMAFDAGDDGCPVPGSRP